MTPPRQRGLSLVELMIGLAIGLFIVATATSLLLDRIREHRALLIESRLMQDLRTAADLVSRDLRRAGYWGESTAGLPRGGAAAAANPYTALAPAAAASDAVSFRFSRDAGENHAVDGNEQFGFRLRRGVIEMLLGSGNWQALTDSGTMIVTAFSVTPRVDEITLQALCEKACAAGAADCPPKQQLRSFGVAITGRSSADAGVVRGVRSQVRLRNDVIVGACPA
ncbi:MAG TPA: prepilin-type N-terminal cleavage/methylation domain-containing protein [Albitalea sp.]